MIGANEIIMSNSCPEKKEDGTVFSFALNKSQDSSRVGLFQMRWRDTILNIKQAYDDMRQAKTGQKLNTNTSSTTNPCAARSASQALTSLTLKVDVPSK